MRRYDEDMFFFQKYDYDKMVKIDKMVVLW